MIALPPVPAWWAGAQCADTSVDFFPERNATKAPALALCSVCPVSAECLDGAMAEELGSDSARFGIRGGLSADDRHKLARQ